LHPKATTESIAAIGTAIPKQQTVFLQAGHLVQFEQADAFNQSVLTFLDTKQSLSTKTK
jgi:pimeloyl-ACP methyl ester carboxylesterase